MLQGMLTPEEVPEDFFAAGDHLRRPAVPAHPLRRASRWWSTTAARACTSCSATTCIRAQRQEGDLRGAAQSRASRRNGSPLHCSTVQVDHALRQQVVTIMHEGASGGGKSEMLEQVHRAARRLAAARRKHRSPARRRIAEPAAGLRAASGHRRHGAVPPVARRRATASSRLMDAEDAWFVRVNHITQYGVDPHLEA